MNDFSELDVALLQVLIGPFFGGLKGGILRDLNSGNRKTLIRCCKATGIACIACARIKVCINPLLKASLFPSHFFLFFFMLSLPGFGIFRGI